MFRKLSGILLGINLPAVDFDVEDPAMTFNQFGIDAVGVPNRIRQTGGFGQVVSLTAVGNPNLHRFDSSVMKTSFSR